MDNKKIDKLYEFLIQNRKYNKAVQKAWYNSVILPYDGPQHKITALLHHVVNTQSQPKIDKIAEFFMEVNKHRSMLVSFEGFLKFLLKGESDYTLRYVDVFKNLGKWPGWGDKTSALFVKSLYHLHQPEYGRQLRIWDDAPKRIERDEQFFLPVDTVIEHIFQTLGIFTTLNFKSINDYLGIRYKGKAMEVWDDLWFWGFITQKSNGDKRSIEWNKNKYWSLLHTDKKPESIKEIHFEAQKFMAILK